MLTRARTSIERGTYGATMRLADHLFERTPAGLTVVRAAGVEMIAGAGYPVNTYRTKSWAVARYEDGSLQIGTHLQTVACVASCAASDCVAVQFGEHETTVIRGGIRDEVSVPAHLRAQSGAYDALEQMIATRGDTSHNPFVNQAARLVLETLVAHGHAEQDAALDDIAAQLAPVAVA